MARRCCSAWGPASDGAPMKRVCAALALCLVPGLAMAQEAPAVHVWAAPAVYGLESTACTGQNSGAQNGVEQTAAIDPAFCAVLDAAWRAQLGQAFVRAVGQHFPGVEAVPGGHAAPGLPAAQRLRGTLVASLRLTRAKLARVERPGGVQVFVPVTLTLDLTDLASGEVVFTRTRSEIPESLRDRAGLDARMAGELPGIVARTMESLVAEAGTAFAPATTAATVLGDVDLGGGQRGYVLDKGRAAGLRTGDAIGEDGRVILAGPDYAIARPVLGTWHDGQTLTRLRASPAQMLARPALLSVVAAAPPGFAPAFVRQMFEDAVGSAGGFAPVPVNPALGPLRVLAQSAAGVSLPETPRAMPDYVASLRVALLDPVSVPSNLAGVSLDRFTALAFVTLTDRTGRVVAAWHAVARIDDTINLGVRFAAQTRQETVLRNALTDLAGQMAGFRPRSLQLPIGEKGGALAIADPASAVPIGATLPVLRPAGHFRGIAGTVLVPVGQVLTGAPTTGGIAAENAGPGRLDLGNGAVVALESAGQNAATRTITPLCSDAGGQLSVQDKGTLPVPAWAAAAPALLAERAALPVTLPDLPAQLAPYRIAFAGWEGFAPAAPASAAPSSVCLLPQIMVQPGTGTMISLAAGFAQMRGTTRAGGAALQTTLKPTAVPDGAAPAMRAAMLQADLAIALIPLAQQAAGQLRPLPAEPETAKQ